VKALNGMSCKVELDDGSEVHALKVNVAQVGDRTTLSLRPERVMIDPASCRTASTPRSRN
jgi:putative spermidine/putrescine transport system ATP-binding protein